MSGAAFNEDQLIEKLRRIEALFAGAKTDGERVAAANAMERIRARLKEVEREDPAVEYTFRVQDLWSKQLLIALLRRYGIKPYRYSGQRRTTVVARVSRRFVQETLWPEYCELQHTLNAYLADVTKRVIERAVGPVGD